MGTFELVFITLYEGSVFARVLLCLATVQKMLFACCYAALNFYKCFF